MQNCGFVLTEYEPVASHGSSERVSEQGPLPKEVTFLIAIVLLRGFKGIRNTVELGISPTFYMDHDFGLSRPQAGAKNEFLPHLCTEFRTRSIGEGPEPQRPEKSYAYPNFFYLLQRHPLLKWTLSYIYIYLLILIIRSP